jgi:hypothetical protein
MARLQQLENQLKQLTNEKKDEKLNEITQFIQEKMLPLFDEDLILKFFGQKNSTSTEKDIQLIKTYLQKHQFCENNFSYFFSDMEKRRNWFIDIYISLGISLCDLSTISDETSTSLTNIIKTLQKHIDINDAKLSNFNYKYNLIKKSYGKVWKLLLKQIEEKSSSQQQEFDQKLLQVKLRFCFIFLFFFFLALSNNEYEIFSYISRTFNSCKISSSLCPFLTSSFLFNIL